MTWSKSWLDLSRNDPCWCGRKRKYKNCHLRLDEDRIGLRQVLHTTFPLDYGHRHLYRYMAADTIPQPDGTSIDPLAEILLESKLYCAFPVEFNDPFESRINYDLTGTLEEIRRDYFEFVKAATGLDDSRAEQRTENWLSTGKHGQVEYFKNLEQSLFHQARAQGFRLLCLTPHPDSLLMWAHYGKGHRGLCLRFESGGPFVSAVKVEYLRDYPTISFFNSTWNDRTRAAFLTKSEAWSYEDEFRIIQAVDGSRIPAKYLRFEPKLLTGIILGCEATDELESRVRDLCHQRRSDLAIIRARRAEGRFAVLVDKD